MNQEDTSHDGSHGKAEDSGLKGPRFNPQREAKKVKSQENYFAKLKKGLKRGQKGARKGAKKGQEMQLRKAGREKGGGMAELANVAIVLPRDLGSNLGVEKIFSDSFYFSI